MRDGPRCFPPDSSCPAVLRCRLLAARRFRLRGCHPLRPRFPSRSPTVSPPVRWRSYNPAWCIATPAVWAPPLSLATTRGIIVIFFSCRYLDVSVPCVRSLLGSVPGSLPAGSPIRISADLGIFAPPRGFSQLVTSFFASESLGIPHAPFSAFLFLFALARSRFLSLVLLLTADASTYLEVASARFLLFAYAYASVCQ